MMNYKVLTQKDSIFSGKFNPAKLEEVLNKLASEGWRVNSMVVATVPGFGSREELVILMEKD